MKEKVLITLHIRKRHILIFALLIIGALMLYSAYFREFMTLPQSAEALLPELPSDLHNKKIAVIAPHCDDETLGQGGLIKRAAEQGSEIKVIIVTDCNKHKIGSERKSESANALFLLGIKSDQIYWNFTEGRNGRTMIETDKLKDDFKNLLKDYQPDLIFIPHPNDTHGDHRWISNTFRALPENDGYKSKTIYYLIHFNFLKFPSPAGLKPDSFLTPPARLININQLWYKFSLSVDEENIKEEAVLKYKSQLKITNPILNRILLDFVRKNELFMMQND